jgi:hypothetical protein
MSQFFLKFWWAALFLLLCYGFYVHGMEARKKDLEELGAKAAELVQELGKANHLKEELLLELESQADPAWIQMVMRKQLGVVSQGDTKVCFEP